MGHRPAAGLERRPGRARQRPDRRICSGSCLAFCTVEPVRTAFVRISYGHQRRQLAIQGMPAARRCTIG